VGAHLVFLDESGFLLTPTVRKTWAPVGLTPIIRHRFRNDRISAISALSISPERTRLGLYWMLSTSNINRDMVFAFLRDLLRHLRGRLVVLLDNGSTHRGKPMREFLLRHPRLRLEYLPAYAPELNPDEGVWGAVKGKLANGRPDDLAELKTCLVREFGKLARSQSRLRGCFRQSELPLHSLFP
jgi:transposase